MGSVAPRRGTYRSVPILCVTAKSSKICLLVNRLAIVAMGLLCRRVLAAQNQSRSDTIQKDRKQKLTIRSLSVFSSASTRSHNS